MKMITSWRLAGPVLGGIMATTTTSALADSELTDLLKVLRSNGTISKDQYDRLRSEADPGKQDKKNKHAPRVQTDGGLKVKSADGAFEFEVGGELWIDAAFYQEDYAAAAEHLAQGNHQVNMYTKYYLARANEEAGNADEAARLYDELAVYNFNGPGYAMFRKDILARAASD